MSAEHVRDLKKRIETHRSKFNAANNRAKKGSKKSEDTAAYHAEQLEILLKQLDDVMGKIHA